MLPVAAVAVTEAFSVSWMSLCSWCGVSSMDVEVPQVENGREPVPARGGAAQLPAISAAVTAMLRDQNEGIMKVRSARALKRLWYDSTLPAQRCSRTSDRTLTDADRHTLLHSRVLVKGKLASRCPINVT